MSDDLPARLAQFLRGKFAADDAQIAGLSRIPGGASRETYRFRARWRKDGREIERGLILRRDPPASLIETERATEFRAYQAAHALGLPVPEPIALEESAAVLDRPFFIMEEITGCQVGNILSADPYSAHAAKIGGQFWTILGKIARADPKALGIADFAGARDAQDCWRREVGRWEKVIDDDELEPQPIARGALRWLKRHPPPRAQKISLVHGDYRTGNFLFDADGNIRGILDWEMAHLGDPLEDLAWALDPLWSHGNPKRPAGTVPREEAIALWEKASGLKAEPSALFWWEIFASLKGVAIWISAAREYADGRNSEPVNAFSGWYPLSVHNMVLAERLEAIA